VELPEPEPVAEEADEELPSGHKEVGAVFFFPVGGEQARTCFLERTVGKIRQPNNFGEKKVL
jgi:hypothetical protein